MSLSAFSRGPVSPAAKAAAIDGSDCCLVSDGDKPIRGRLTPWEALDGCSRFTERLRFS
jgi:hypothetical protein